MLKHLNEQAANPARTVVLGARGFLGAELVRQLEGQGAAVLGLGSHEIDLTSDGAGAALARHLRPDDTLVMLAALTPDKGRDTATLMRNLRMADAICAALREQPVAHAVYVSSDAVYSFRSGLIGEETPPEPGDLYAAMHHTREIMVKDCCRDIPLAILRPTLLYGAGDTHNSYGPNRFRRLAAADGKITLGGEGEETRDHLHVADAAALIALVLQHRSVGLLNLASGRSESFRQVAEMVAALFDPPAEVRGSPRIAPVTHRSFDVTARQRAFPGFAPRPLSDGLRQAHEDVTKAG